jgi:hypothetical protein
LRVMALIVVDVFAVNLTPQRTVVVASSKCPLGLI